MNLVDRFLNSVTMYRLVLHGLTAISFTAIIFSHFGLLGYAWSTSSLLISITTLVFACYFFNLIFSKVFNVFVNAESAFITALILFLILPPASSARETIILILAGFIAMGSKFLIAPFKKHIFNPAAFSAVILYIFNLTVAVWWVGDVSMIPIVAIIGLLIVKKIRRFLMFLSFIVFWTIFAVFFGAISFFAIGPIFFFGTIMMTEPSTTPPTRKLQLIYGAINGIFLNIYAFGFIALTPEIVLISSNIFSYIVGLKRKILFTLNEKKEIAKDIFEFVFIPDHKFSYSSGQYLEWTLAHDKADRRGARRFFTIASSPTEDVLRLGVKFNTPPSSFKKNFFEMNIGNKILAGQLGGDFILPSDAKKKLVFLAGGIGVTPFRSMIKYLIDKGEKRDIVILYSAKSEEEIAYRDLFQEAETMLGVKVKFVIGEFITSDLLKKEIEDFKDRIFYISGPEMMVTAFKKMLKGLGVSRMNIVTDYFPGFIG